MLIRTIAALGALAAVGVALVIAIPAIANTSPCSGAIATPNSSGAGIVADCNALIASKNALGAGKLNWDVNTPRRTK